MRPLFEVNGVPGPTTRIVCYDFSGQMNEDIYTRNGHIAIAMTLTAEVHAVRIAMGGGIPTQGVQPNGHTIATGTFVRITNPAAILTLRFMNAVAQTDGILVVTPEFEAGV